MPLARDETIQEPVYLSDVKRLSGQRIEQERRRRGLTQASMGKKIGYGTTWVRNIESGYPKVRLDDHILCYEYLSLSPLAIIIPLLCLIHGHQCPPHLLLGNLRHLEHAIMDCIVNFQMNYLRGVMKHFPSEPADEAEGGQAIHSREIDGHSGSQADHERQAEPYPGADEG